MDYQAHYDKLILRSQNRLLEGYVERHHILPRCMGGSNDVSNIVCLTPEEHYVAHQLLVKLHPDHSGLAKACLLMSQHKGHRMSNKSYGWIRRKCAKHQSDLKRGKTKDTCPIVKKLSETLSGRRKEDYEYLRVMSERQKTENKDNSPRVKKQAETLTGRTKKTHDYLAKHSQIMQEKYTGETLENSERVRKSAKTRSKTMTGQTKHNSERVRKTAEGQIGKTKHNNEGYRKRSETQSRLNPEQRLLVVQMKNSGMTMKMVHNYFTTELQVMIHYSTLCGIYRANKHLVA